MEFPIRDYKLTYTQIRKYFGDLFDFISNVSVVQDGPAMFKIRYLLDDGYVSQEDVFYINRFFGGIFKKLFSRSIAVVEDEKHILCNMFGKSTEDYINTTMYDTLFVVHKSKSGIDYFPAIEKMIELKMKKKWTISYTDMYIGDTMDSTDTGLRVRFTFVPEHSKSSDKGIFMEVYSTEHLLEYYK